MQQSHNNIKHLNMKFILTAYTSGWFRELIRFPLASCKPNLAKNVAQGVGEEGALSLIVEGTTVDYLSAYSRKHYSWLSYS